MDSERTRTGDELALTGKATSFLGQSEDPSCDVFSQLESSVIQPGLCTHCGTCVGLSAGTLEMHDTTWGPIPSPTSGVDINLSPLASTACPGLGVNYPELYDYVFGELPTNWLIGCYRELYVGYSSVPEIRRRGASGGVITQTLIYLLTHGLVDGAVVVRQGYPRPWLAEPFIARSQEEIAAASQSVYVPVPVNALLGQIESFEGRLAYVGLPDQVAALRRLQQSGHPGANKIEYILGPYVGTTMYISSIESYLRSNGIRDIGEVTELRYREGAWPGYLHIRTRSGRVLRAEKFYYNYLIPFHITRSTLLSVDFTNELTDISVGDAWHPRYESQGQGFSIVIARTAKGAQLLHCLNEQGLVHLEGISLDDALAMHGHMLDFKKRGSFIRLGWRSACGRPVPHYGYRPKSIPLARRLVEVVISSIFVLCRQPLVRSLAEHIPLALLGPSFDFLRRIWKNVSKPTKRKGLGNYEVSIRLVDYEQ
ncbi:MAG: coenzyme F420 hydrogenase [Chloroflexi bacterium]|nr:coenzyme F420 hydrogenase [Chloroflexota bacterium]